MTKKFIVITILNLFCLSNLKASYDDADAKQVVKLFEGYKALQDAFEKRLEHEYKIQYDHFYNQLKQNVSLKAQDKLLLKATQDNIEINLDKAAIEFNKMIADLKSYMTDSFKTIAETSNDAVSFKDKLDDVKEHFSRMFNNSKFSLDPFFNLDLKTVPGHSSHAKIKSMVQVDLCCVLDNALSADLFTYVSNFISQATLAIRNLYSDQRSFYFYTKEHLGEGGSAQIRTRRSGPIRGGRLDWGLKGLTNVCYENILVCDTCKIKVEGVESDDIVSEYHLDDCPYKNKIKHNEELTARQRIRLAFLNGKFLNMKERDNIISEKTNIDQKCIDIINSYCATNNFENKIALFINFYSLKYQLERAYFFAQYKLGKYTPSLGDVQIPDPSNHITGYRRVKLWDIGLPFKEYNCWIE